MHSIGDAKTRLCRAFLMCPALMIQGPAVTPPAPKQQSDDVFVSGILDPSQAFGVFRIPAICRTRQGTLLAFAEGRRSIADQSSNVIVLRRKPVGTAGWGPLGVVARDEPASLNNPCVLPTDGTVWLMYQRYPAGYNERTTVPGFDADRSCRTFLVASRDEGRTWSKPRELTEIVKGPGIRSNASGPGIGIVLERGPHRGRFLFPVNEGANGAWSAFAVFSDDRGKTWKRGATAPKGPGLQPNETQFVEMSDGSVLLNARNQAAGRFRLSSISRDGGETWSEAMPEPNLPDPICMGSIARLSFRPNIILFSNPADPTRRAKGTLRLSDDDGTSWKVQTAIADGSFEYSCLCPLPGKKVGVLYEAREPAPSGGAGYRIRYVVLAVDQPGRTAR